MYFLLDHYTINSVTFAWGTASQFDISHKQIQVCCSNFFVTEEEDQLTQYFHSFNVRDQEFSPIVTKMRLLLALGLGTASARKCQVCTAAKNHMEEFTGLYDQGTVSIITILEILFDEGITLD